MLDLVIESRPHDLGGFQVGRVLPFRKRRMVGPFIFFDRMGPHDMVPPIPRTTDVRPHPAHRAVDGHLSVQRANDPSRQHRRRAGDPARRTQLDDCRRRHLPFRTLRRHARRTAGTWTASRHGLPCRRRTRRTGFLRPLSTPASLPGLQDDGVQARLIAGSAYGLTSPAVDPFAALLPACGTEGGCSPATAGRVSGARRLRRPRQHQGRRQPLRRRPDGCLLRGRRREHRGGRAVAPHAARRRAAGRPAHLVELRLLEQGAHRAGQGRLARRSDRACRRWTTRSSFRCRRRRSLEPEPMS